MSENTEAIILLRLVKRGEYSELRKLMSAGVSPNQRKNGTLSPLFVAAARGDVRMIELLLSFGADVDIGADKGGYTPLFAAAVEGHRKAVRTLLEAGANPLAGVMGRTVSGCLANNTPAEVFALLEDYEQRWRHGRAPRASKL